MLEILLIWFVGTVVVAAIGSDRKFGGWAALFVSLFLSPIVGLIAVLASPSKQSVAYQKKMLELQKQQLEAAQQPAPPSVADELLKLKTLLDSGAITPDDYEGAKNILLRK